MSTSGCIHITTDKSQKTTFCRWSQPMKRRRAGITKLDFWFDASADLSSESSGFSLGWAAATFDDGTTYPAAGDDSRRPGWILITMASLLDWVHQSDSPLELNPLESSFRLLIRPHGNGKYIDVIIAGERRCTEQKGDFLKIIRATVEDFHTKYGPLLESDDVVAEEYRLARMKYCRNTDT